MAIPEELIQGLTAKQETFAQRIALDGMDASAAYRLAYDAERMKPETIWRNAHDVLTNTKVSARIAQLRLSLSEKARVKAADVIKEAAAVAFTPLTDLVEWEDHGENLRLKASSSLTRAQAASILSVKVKRRRQVSGQGRNAQEWEIEETEIKQQPKLAALELLARLFPEFSQKHEVLDRESVARIAEEHGLDPDELLAGVDLLLTQAPQRGRKR